MTEAVQAQSVEPRAMTRADLLVLGIGCAGAFAVPGLLSALRVVAATNLHLMAELATESLQRACLPLALVIFVRRLQYGGPCRLVRLLILFCSMPLLARAVRCLLTGHWVTLTEAYAWWEQLAEIVSPIAFVVYAIVCKRLSGWAQMLLLGFAALAFWLGGGFWSLYSWQEGAAVGLPVEAVIVIEVSFRRFVTGMIYGLPTARVLLERPRVGWTWVDWTGAGLGAMCSALMIGGDFVMILKRAFALHPPAAYVWRAEVASFVLSLVLCFVLAWRQRSRARRAIVSSGLP